MKYNGNQIASGFNSILDTGTSVIIGTPCSKKPSGSRFDRSSSIYHRSAGRRQENVLFIAFQLSPTAGRHHSLRQCVIPPSSSHCAAAAYPVVVPCFFGIPSVSFSWDNGQQVRLPSARLALPCRNILASDALAAFVCQWTVSADALKFGNTGIFCIAGIGSADLGLGADTWLLGDVFLKSQLSQVCFSVPVLLTLIPLPDLYTKYVVDPPNVQFAALT